MQSIYHKDYLHQALTKYPATIYGGLLKPIYSGIPRKRAHNRAFVKWSSRQVTAQRVVTTALTTSAKRIIDLKQRIEN